MKKILIIGPSWVGDMMMSQSLFKVLKQQNPDSEIDVLAPSWTSALLARMPEVNQALTSPFAHGQFVPAKRFKLGRGLQNKQYDQAIVIPNSWKSALVPAAARIPQRTGWLGELRYGLLNDTRKLNTEKYPLMVQRLVALAHPAGTAVTPQMCPIPTLEVKTADVDQALNKFNLAAQAASDQPILALAPGAEFGPSKKWPAEYYATLAQQKLQQGWQVWLFGSPKDQEIAAKIQSTVPDCIDLVGHTSLSEAVDLLSVVDFVVSNDSGLMHIAAGLGKQMVAIYGSTDPKFTPPLGDKIAVLEDKTLDCRPCFKRDCPLGHHHCMRHITPEQVSSYIQIEAK